jgi:hypothetical protein
MTVKISTTITNIERDILSLENRELILQFLEFVKSTGTSKKYPKALSLIHFSLSDALNNEALLPQSRNIPCAWRVAIFRIMSDKIAMISSFDIRELYSRVSAVIT